MFPLLSAFCCCQTPFSHHRTLPTAAEGTGAAGWWTDWQPWAEPGCLKRRRQLHLQNQYCRVLLALLWTQTLAKPANGRLRFVTAWAEEGRLSPVRFPICFTLVGWHRRGQRRDRSKGWGEAASATVLQLGALTCLWNCGLLSAGVELTKPVLSAADARGVRW